MRSPLRSLGWCLALASATLAATANRHEASLRLEPPIVDETLSLEGPMFVFVAAAFAGGLAVGMLSPRRGRGDRESSEAVESS